MRRHRAALTHLGSDPVGVIAMVSQQRPQRCPVIPTLRPNGTWPRHGKIDANGPKPEISQHFIFRSRNLVQPYQSAHPSGYYDASLGRGYERATISLRSGWCAGVTAYGGGSEASAQDHRLPRRRRSIRVDSDGREFRAAPDPISLAVAL